jgi:hypothetical protein
MLSIYLLLNFSKSPARNFQTFQSGMVVVVGGSNGGYDGGMIDGGDDGMIGGDDDGLMVVQLMMVVMMV